MTTFFQGKSKHKRLTSYIVAGILVAALLAGILCFLVYVGKSTSAHQGVQNEFELASSSTAESTQDAASAANPKENQDTTSSTIAVLNAWGREGAAAQTCEKLAQVGYLNCAAKNAPLQDYPNSVVLFRNDEAENRAKDIAHILDIATLDRLEEDSTWAGEYEIVVIIGQDAFDKVS